MKKDKTEIIQQIESKISNRIKNQIDKIPKTISFKVGTDHFVDVISLASFVFLDFEMGVLRMKGKCALVVYAFCLSVDYQRYSEKLLEEIEKFGDPPSYPDEETANRFNKRGFFLWKKAVSMGVPLEDIHLLTDVDLGYDYLFENNKMLIDHMLVNFDLSVCSISKNKYYQKFLEWQFFRLDQLDRIRLYSNLFICDLDRRPVKPYDRARGEGALVRKNILIKEQLIKPYPLSLEPYEDKSIFLLAKIDHPSTLFARTNTCIMMQSLYALYSVDEELFICDEITSLNLSYQDHEVQKIIDLDPMELIGHSTTNPISEVKESFILPMTAKYLSHYNRQFFSTHNMHSIREVVPLISSVDYTFKVDQQYKLLLDFNFDDQLIPDAIFSLSYFTEEISDDIKIVQQGTSEIQNAQYRILKYLDQDRAIKTDIMLSSGIVYYDTDMLVQDRKGNLCGVTTNFKWHFTYDKSWINDTLNALQEIDIFNEKQNLIHWIEQIHQVPCFLSTHSGMSFNWKEETVSSTAESYLATYYATLAKEIELLPIEEINYDFFDYILGDGDEPASNYNINIIKEIANLSLTGSTVSISQSDLKSQAGFLFHLVSILPKRFIPRKINLETKIIIEKSTRLFKKSFNLLSQRQHQRQTLQSYYNKFSIDGLRFAYADSGNGVHRKLDLTLAEHFVLRTYDLYQWYESLDLNRSYRYPTPQNIYERIFLESIKEQAIQLLKLYDKSHFKNVSVHFFGFINAKDRYFNDIEICGLEINMYFVELFLDYFCRTLAPVLPHLSENIWINIFSNHTSIFEAGFPEIFDLDQSVLSVRDYINSQMKIIRKKLFSNPKRNDLTVYLFLDQPIWKDKSLELVLSHLEDHDTFPEKKTIARTISSDPQLKPLIKKMMPVIEELRKQHENGMPLSFTLPFNEHLIWTEFTPYVILAIPELHSLTVLPSDISPPLPTSPTFIGSPSIPFYHFSTPNITN